ncbi:MAG: NrsF family protein [Myxococcota bacterium]|nr:NrsF family protein [Myxococcota bacterium]
MGPSPELRDRVLAAVAAEPVDARAGGARRHLAVLVAGFGLMVPVSVVLGGPGFRGRPPGYVVAIVISWFALAVATSWAGVSRGRSMLGRSPLWRAFTAAATPATLLVVSLVAGRIWPQMLQEAPGAHKRVLWFVAPPQIVCLVATPLFASGPLLAFALVRRASDPVAPRVTGAALGAAAAAWAAVAIALHCSRGSVHHVVVGHVLPAALLPLVGAALCSQIVAVRGCGDRNAMRRVRPDG